MARRTSSAALIVPIEAIERCILVLRGRRVMLGRDLAGFYATQPRALNQAVRRNRDRFPDDFMFQLTAEETQAVLRSRSQSVILKRGQNVKYRPLWVRTLCMGCLCFFLKLPRAWTCRNLASDASDMGDLTRASVAERLDHLAGQRRQILNSIRPGADDDHSERQRRKIVLALQVAIHREKGVDPAGSELQQLAVFRAGPSHSLDGHHFVTHQFLD